MRKAHVQVQAGPVQTTIGLCERDAFTKLPLELLTEIGEILYAKCIKFTATWVLSLVNRRWRSVILPIVFRKLELKRPTYFSQFLARFLAGGVWQHLAPAVRSVCIWSSYNKRLRWGQEVVCFPRDITLPFINLREFVCRTPVVRQQLLIPALSRCSTLRSISMVFADRWPSWLLENLPDLQTLRLYAFDYNRQWRISVHGADRIVTLDPQPISYASITVLALHARGMNSTLINDGLSKFYFLQLQVFVIGNCNIPHPITIFQFIQRHSSLAEVNVDLSSCHPICVEALLSLINGTGDWYNAESPQVQRDISHIGRWPSPAIDPRTQIVFYGFAYTRAVLYPIGGSPKQASSDSTYTCTALALRWLHVRVDDEDEDEDQYESPFFRVLEQFAIFFPDVGELRLQVNDIRCGLHEHFENKLSESLRPLRKLRKLALHWLAEDFFDWKLHEIDDTSQIDEWQDSDRAFVTLVAQQLAHKLPLLAEFDWYIVDPTALQGIETPFPFDDDYYPTNIVAWNFRIERYESRTNPVRAFGNLKYTGTSRDGPLPLLILVGQELKRVSERGYIS